MAVAVASSNREKCGKSLLALPPVVRNMLHSEDVDGSNPPVSMAVPPQSLEANDRTDETAPDSL